MKCRQHLRYFVIFLSALWILAPGRCIAQNASGSPIDSMLLAKCDGSSGTSLAFSNDGNKLLTSGEKQVRIWNTVDFSVVVGPWNNERDVTVASLSPNGDRVAFASGNTLHVWDIKTGTKIFSFEHVAQVNDVAFSSDGSRIATACMDKFARIWEASTGKFVVKFAHPGDVLTVSFNPAGEKLLCSSTGPSNQQGVLEPRCEVRVWNIASTKELWLEKCEGRPLFSASGKFVAVPAFYASVYETQTGDLLARWNFNTGRKGIEIVALSVDGRRLLAAGDDGNDSVDAAARLLEILPKRDKDDGTPWSFKQVCGLAPNCALKAAQLSSDGRTIALISTTRGGGVSGIWNPLTGSKLIDFSQPDTGTTPDTQSSESLVAFDPNNKYIAVSYAENGVSNHGYTKIWKIPNH